MNGTGPEASQALARQAMERVLAAQSSEQEAAAEPKRGGKLKLGDSGDRVRRLQARLVKAGRLAEGTFATGIYDRATRLADKGDD